MGDIENNNNDNCRRSTIGTRARWQKVVVLLLIKKEEDKFNKIEKIKNKRKDKNR